MSSDQNLNHHNGLVPEPQPLTWIRAHADEQGAATGVLLQDAVFAANLGVSARQVQGPAAGGPGQHATQEGGEGVALVTGAGTEVGVTWGVLNDDARSRPAPLVGGNTPVRSPAQQRIAHLRAELERAKQYINPESDLMYFNSKPDGTHVPGGEPNSFPPNHHEWGSQSTSPFHTSSSPVLHQNVTEAQS